MCKNPLVFVLYGFVCLGLLSTAGTAFSAASVVQDMALEPGWNAVFLEVSPDDRDELTEDDRAPARVFDHPDIAMVWSLVDPENLSQFISSPEDLGFNDPSWRVYIPSGNPESLLTNLYSVTPGQVYLVKLSGNQPVTLPVTGRPAFRNIQWQPNQYNLVGFYVDPAEPVSFNEFLNLAGANVTIYQLNPADSQWQPVSPGTAIEAGKGYWVFNDGSINQSGPVQLSATVRRGIRFPREVGVRQLALINRSGSGGSNIAFQVEPGVQLQYFAGYDSSDGTTPVWNSLQGHSINAPNGQEVSLLIGAARSGLSETTEVTLTVSGLGARIRIPVTVEPLASQTGLWVGVVQLTKVTNINSDATDQLEPVAAPLQMKLLLHVDQQGNTRLLKQVYLLGNNVSGELALVTQDSRIGDFEALNITRREAMGYRLSTSAYDFAGDSVALNGTFSEGLMGTISITPDLPTHPMKHRYHRYHDDLDNSTGSVINTGSAFYDEVWAGGTEYSPAS